MSTVCIMHTVHAQRLPRAPSKSPLVKIREMGLAIVHMAEEQMAMEQRLNSRLDNAVIAFKNWMLV